MAAKKVVKTGATVSVMESATKALKVNKADKVFVSKDGYVFLKESDVRAYVGKDGSYSIVTESDMIEFTSPTDPEKKEKSGKAADSVKNSDILVDEHKKEGDE